jgi:hypothetical protein
VFSKFEFIDVNAKGDTTNSDPNATCVWFTMLLNKYEEVDDITDEVAVKYEYLSFPCTATDYSHLVFYTSDVPYLYGIHYNTGR